MDRKIKLFLLGCFVLFIFIVILDTNAEEPVDWTPSYVHTDDKALATEVFYQSLQNLTQTIKHYETSPFEVFQDSVSPRGSYFFLDQYVNLTPEESHYIMDWVSSGQTAFISSEGIPKLILDTLGLDVSFYVSNSTIEYQPSFNLKSPQLQLPEFKPSRKKFEYLYFSEIDSSATQVLGLVKPFDEDQTQHTNYIKVNFGEGQFLLHLAPQVYTNYFMVDKNNSQYTARTLSYLDLNAPLLWDNYYKSGKQTNTNLMYYLLSNPNLKSAYYLIIFTSLLFVFFAGKRKQRPIPIQRPFENKTYEFTQTIAGMYLDKKDHKAIAEKQIKSFLESIRSTYHLQTSRINEAFLEDLASKTTKDYQKLKEIFEYIHYINSAEIISEQELKALDKKMTSLNI